MNKAYAASLHQELPSPVREQAMTIEEMLINKGRRQGIEQGIERGIEQGIEQGIEKGIEKGAEQTKYTMAKNLWDITQDYELVARVSNLSIEEVKKLIAQGPAGQKH